MSENQSADRPHIMVATPCYGGQVTAAYMDSVLRLQIACLKNGVDFRFKPRGGDALITRVRAELVADFLGWMPKPTHLLFIDSDIAFEAEQVFRLLAFDADVTAAAYPIKEIDWGKVGNAVRANQSPQTAGLTYVTSWIDPNQIAARKDFARVRYAGTGFLLIRRSVIERLCAAHPELKYRRIHYSSDALQDSPHRFALFECMIDPQTGEYLSEDFSFCRRWTDLGGEIWLDLKSKLMHVGQYAFSGNLTDCLVQRGPHA
jgi:hypothetical protein